MDFSYQSTFLRSALVKDPFSLGDLGPEDVLRIESQFPNLFDSSPQVNKHPSTLRTPISRISCARTRTGLTVPPSKPVNPRCPCDCCQTKGPTGIKKLSPRVSKPSPVKIVPQSLASPIKKRFNTSSASKQPEEEFLLVRDFKRMLEDVIKDKVDQRRKPVNLQNIANISKATFKGVPELKKMTPKQRTYDEEDVNIDMKKVTKKPPIADRSVISASNQLKKYISQLHEQKYKLRKTELSKDKKVSRNHSALPVNIIRKKEKTVKRTMSALGFLRQTILKSNSSPSDTKFMERTKKSVKFAGDFQSDNIKVGRSGKIEYECDHGNHNPSNRSDSERRESLRTNEDNTAEKITTSKSAASHEPIHLKGKEKPLLPKLNGSNFGTSDTFKSYEQMKLAKTLASKYEKIGLLKKCKIRKKHDIDKPVVVQRREMNPKEKVHTVPVQLPTQLPNLLPSSPIPATKLTKNSNILEKIAKELVYVEVRRHLHDLQIKEKEKVDTQQDIYDAISSNNTDETKPERRSVDKCKSKQEMKCNITSKPIYVSITTPELTSSSYSSHVEIKNIRPAANANKSSETCPEVATPVTPDLTLSTLKSTITRAMKNSCNNIIYNDNTDCSEISDFICSEKETKTTPKSKKQSPPQEKSESIEVVTPRLSESPRSISDHSTQSQKHIDFRDVKTKIFPNGRKKSGKSSHSEDSLLIPTPEKSSLMSCSLTNKSSTTMNANRNENKTKTEQKLNDKEQMSSIKQFQEVLSTDSEEIKSELSLEKNEEIEVDEITYESESEMVFLSDGEFIGNAYTSPGELSLSKPFSRYLSEGLLLNSSNSSSSTVISVQASQTSTSTSVFEKSGL